MSVSAELQLFSHPPILVAEQLGMSGRGFVGPVGSDVALPGLMQKVGAPLRVYRVLVKRFGVEAMVGLVKCTGPSRGIAGHSSHR